MDKQVPQHSIHNNVNTWHTWQTSTRSSRNGNGCSNVGTNSNHPIKSFGINGQNWQEHNHNLKPKSLTTSPQNVKCKNVHGTDGEYFKVSTNSLVTVEYIRHNIQ